MPIFNINAKIKPVKASKYKVLTTNDTIIQRNVKGVVWINLNKIHYIKLEDNREFFIHPDSFDTNGCKELYLKRLLHGRRVKYVRDAFYGLYSRKDALPFIAGCCIIGDIILNNVINQKFVKIKKVYEDIKNNPDAKAASKFLRDNYELIYGREIECSE